MRCSTSCAKALQAGLLVLLASACQGPPSADTAGLMSPSTPVHSPEHRQSAPISVVDPSRRTQVLSAGASPPAWMRFGPAAAQGRAYVSQFTLTDVNEYAQNEKKNAPPLCRIAGQPYVNGIGVDEKGRLWIPAGGVLSGVITEFAPNCGKALFHIQDSDGQPAAIAFDSKANVYVLNIFGASGTGNIDVYPPASKKKKNVLQDPSAFEWFDETIDSADNLFMVYADVYGLGHVVEFAGGKNPATSLPISLGFPGGVTLDAAGNLLVVDQDARNVSVFAPPYTAPAIATFSLQADSIPCRFTRRGTLLYCADFTNASVDVYRYDVRHPGAASYVYSFTNAIQPGSQNAGIALSPAAPN